MVMSKRCQFSQHVSGAPVEISVESTATGWVISSEKQTLTVASSDLLVTKDGTGVAQGVLSIGDQRLPYAVVETQTHVYCWLAGAIQVLAKPEKRQRRGAGGSGVAGGGSGGGAVKANMPGKVLSVSVAVGDTVQVGDAVVIVESMKMEMTLNAAVSGIVESVNTEANAMVDIGETLVVITEEQSE